MAIFTLSLFSRRCEFDTLNRWFRDVHNIFLSVERDVVTRVRHLYQANPQRLTGCGSRVTG